MIDKIQSMVGRGQEKLTFGLYFVVTLVSAWFVADVFATGWKDGHVVRVVLEHVPAIYLNLSIAVISTFLFGIFIGLLILLNIDPKKRWQGRLLLVGTAIAVVVMQTQGVFNVPLISQLPWFIGGTAIGIIGGGGQRLVRNQTAEALEFRPAASRLFYLLAVLTIGALLEAHINYPQLFEISYSNSQIALVQPFPPENASFGIQMRSIYTDVFASVIFLGTLREFIQYDAERSFFVLGPRESGKTLFLIGSYLEALESYNSENDGGLLTTPMNPTSDLVDMVSQLDASREEWIVEATEAGQVRELGFQYVHGQVFPLNIRLQTLDYAGEHLDSIADALAGILDIQDYPNPAILRALVTNVANADTLIFLIDMERFFDEGESLEISEYFDIMQSVENKEVILVATKCDLLAEEFTQETGLQPVRYYEDFLEYTNQRLMESQQVKSLIAETAGTEIHPVYYQTRETETGERVPMRDESNSVMVVGFDELLDKLGR